MPLAAETHGRQSSIKDIQHAHSTLKTHVTQYTHACIKIYSYPSFTVRSLCHLLRRHMGVRARCAESLRSSSHHHMEEGKPNHLRGDTSS